MIIWDFVFLLFCLKRNQIFLKLFITRSFCAKARIIVPRNKSSTSQAKVHSIQSVFLEAGCYRTSSSSRNKALVIAL